MTDDLESLRTTAAAIAALDLERESLVRRRDELIVAARISGATWNAMQEASRLTPRGVALALKRSAPERPGRAV